MQASLVIVPIAFCTLVISASQAKAGVDALRASDNAIWGSAGMYQLGYEEPAPPPDLGDSERDWFPSIAAGVNILGSDEYENIYFALEGDYSFGNAHYNGSYILAPSVQAQTTTQEKISTMDARIGEGFTLGNNAMLIPYAELGYRYWRRDVNGNGDAEDYQNFDALAGLMLQVSPTDSLILSAYGSAGTTFLPAMQTSGLTFDLGNSAMYKLGGKIGYDVTDRVELFTTLDYDHFSYGESPGVYGYYEPNSNTNETEVRVGIAWHFQ